MWHLNSFHKRPGRLNLEVFKPLCLEPLRFHPFFSRLAFCLQLPTKTPCSNVLLVGARMRRPWGRSQHLAAGALTTIGDLSVPLVTSLGERLVSSHMF